MEQWTFYQVLRLIFKMYCTLSKDSFCRLVFSCLMKKQLIWAAKNRLIDSVPRNFVVFGREFIVLFCAKEQFIMEVSGEFARKAFV